MMMSKQLASTLFGLAIVFTISSSQAVDAAKPNQSKAVDFAREVFPIFQRSCIECHGAEKQESDLRLDERENLLDSGMIEIGNSDESELIHRILLPRGHDDVMPSLGEPLSKRQVSIIRRWIQQGANWPQDFKPAGHWAYLSPKKLELPEVENADWAKSPIDAFVLQRAEEEGLSISPKARPEKLIRRAYFDLIGLPPTPEVVNAFVANPTEKHFEQIVDELLKRPQFGERWARPWLDLARYADSHGFQRDNLRDIWAYRDWVIKALNDDMPFDQFTIEQIAGDLLPNATESQKIATGFHRCTPTNVEAGSLPEETRIEQVIDRVNTTGAVWLGTTLECCQCHDHKYDPFSQKDYYQLLAYFNNTEMEADRVSKSPSSIKFKGPSMSLVNKERDSKRVELQKQIAVVKKQQAERSKELDATLEEWVASIFQTLEESPQTHTLAVDQFLSEGTTDSYKVLEDGSILLVGGDPPTNDHYQASFRTEVPEIRAFRLDALQHDSLPGKGPGRGDPVRRNFVLNKFSVELREIDADENGKRKTKQLAFSSAKASFSQTGWDVAGALDDTPKSGWAIAPKFNESHWAVFILDEPLNVPENMEIVVSLAHEYGGARAIGNLKISAITGNYDADSIPGDIVKAAKKPTEKWSKQDRKKLLDYCVAQDKVTKKLKQDSTKVQKQITQLAPDTTLVMIELDEARKSTIFERGDYRNPGEGVLPGTPAALHDLPKGPSNRLALAKWLVAQENPLVARVTVNRWWAELFGRGIVPTQEDFGIKGDSPTHPELLDWLAVEFMENGWSMKKLLKTIVLSNTYQQSSNITPEAAKKDNINQWLTHGPRFRMDAEMIRDNALSVSGLLSLKQFGPSIYPYQPDGLWKKVGGDSYNYKVSPGSEQYRRGLYVILKRGSPYPSFSNFDATARLACTVSRSRTNTPLQALTLLNDPVYVEAAKALAKRVIVDRGKEPLETQLDYAFQLCTARKPTDSERNAIQHLYQQQLSSYKKTNSDKQAPAAEMNAWTSVATVLLNLHETITKD
ncbi:MAG: hypothetical protein COA78_18335 [Blastopirellula sp.]|nr:MAG: hypothetical protein COA78_18335 [Blastopirellula sp.]